MKEISWLNHEARGADALRIVVWRGMSLTLIGVALGLAASLALTRIMKNLFFEVSATDPATYALIALLMLGVALIASYIPARRAAKIDPLKSIRPFGALHAERLLICGRRDWPTRPIG